jgi:hypothetical protein
LSAVRAHELGVVGDGVAGHGKRNADAEFLFVPPQWIALRRCRRVSSLEYRFL